MSLEEFSSIDEVKKCSFLAWPSSLRSLSPDYTVHELDRVALKDLLEPSIHVNQLNTTTIGSLLRAIDYTGGKFLKLNWSGPSDCSGIVATTFAYNPEQALILLKSSDKILHDIIDPYYTGENDHEYWLNTYHLIVKDRIGHEPCDEFRYFIINGELIVASPRYTFSCNESDHDEFFSFYKMNIREHLQGRTCIIDLCRSNLIKNGSRKIMLLDMGPLVIDDETFILGQTKLREILHGQATRPYFVTLTKDDVRRWASKSRINDYPIELTQGLISGNTVELMDSFNEYCNKHTHVP